MSYQIKDVFQILFPAEEFVIIDLDFAPENIETLGKTKPTISLGGRHKVYYLKLVFLVYYYTVCN
jgi:hypothetical protein